MPVGMFGRVTPHRREGNRSMSLPSRASVRATEPNSATRDTA
jgi:hypothetical protein